jgi:hypothetical protein
VDEVTEVADGILRVKESTTVLLAHSEGRTGTGETQSVSGDIECEVKRADSVLVMVEGTLLLMEGSSDGQCSG